MTLTQFVITDRIKAQRPSLQVTITDNVIVLYDATADRNCSCCITPSNYIMSIEDFDKSVIKPMLAALENK